MKKMRIIDLFGVNYAAMSDKINTVLAELENGGKKIVDYKVMGDQLSKCAVFVMYEE